MKIFKIKNLNIVYTEEKDGNMRDEKNRKKILEKLGLKYLYIPKQEHTNIVAPFVNMSAPADGLYTDLKNVPIGVLTADCMAIVITDFKGLVVLHAGWKGLVNGIIQNGLKYFSNKENLFAFISPSIRKCCYEVGKEFYQILEEKNIDTKYLINKNGRLFFDLQGLAHDILKKEGVKEILDTNLCSKCGENIFSYRNGNFEERILTMAYLE
jgi:YfiH family protein